MLSARGLAWLQATGHKLSSPQAGPRRTLSPRRETGKRAPVTLQILTRLAMMVEFLETNHRREEGLYRRDGPRVETEDLLEFCITRDLPDLAMYSSHSITAVIKHCLLDRFEPVVPYTISAQMLQASEGATDTGIHAIATLFKQIQSASREFLRLFLLHLHQVSRTPACRMSAENIAAHVGHALIRPCEDKKLLASRTGKMQRQVVARILIDQAPFLPYDCVTEMVELEPILDCPNVPGIEKDPGPLATVSSKPESNDRTHSSNSERKETPVQVQTATKMHPTEDDDDGGEHEPLFVRCSDAHNNVTSTEPVKRIAACISPSASIVSSSSNRKGSIVIEDYDSDAVEAETSIPSFNATVGTVTTNTATIDTNDVGSPVAPTILDTQERQEKSDEANSSIASSSNCKEHRVASKKHPCDPFADEVTGRLENADIQGPRTGLAKKKSGFITEFRGILSRRVSKPDIVSQRQQQKREGPSQTDSNATRAIGSIETNYQKPSSLIHSEDKTTMTGRVQEQCDRDTQTIGAPPVLRDTKATNTDDAEPGANIERAAKPSELPPAARDILKRNLLDMQTLLKTADAALYGTPPFTEASRALHQLHTHALKMIDSTLSILTVPEDYEVDLGDTRSTSMLQTNKEFLDFLEAQSKTQVNILEVEVKAGQELLRLLKAQHQQELKALEQEITALRVTSTETERLSADLRTELRKCRNELACQAAYTTRLSREKRDVEERLASSETHQQSRELALARASEELEKMKKVAADAQLRVKSTIAARVTSSSSLDNQREAVTVHPPGLQIPMASVHKASDDKSLVRAEKFLATAKPTLLSVKQKQRLQPTHHRSTSSLKTFNAALASYHEKATSTNVMALERLKRNMSSEIQNQIAATKLALQEIESFEPSDSSLEADQDELRALQDDLGTKSLALSHTMEESRRHLAQLLSGPYLDIHNNPRPTATVPRPWSSDATGLLQELTQLIEREPAATIDTAIQRSDGQDPPSSSAAPLDDWQREASNTASLPRRREPQSEAYRSWVVQKTQRVSEMARFCDRRSVEQAQESMRSLQRTLAALHEENHNED